MVKKIAGIGALLLLLLVVGKLQARPPMDVGLDYFYDSLAPYGEWISMNPWGWVWCPYDIGVDWRPYTVGNWDYSDYGWTFVSDEPWAWATYHYGRWGFDDDCGWYWVPDSVWGPAWVGWRFGGGFMGWCPLPPGIRWHMGFGLDFGGFDLDDVGWSRWNFCELGHFADRDLRRFVFDPARNVNLMRMTRNATNYSFADNRIINNNIPLSDIERGIGHNVTHYRIADAPGGLNNRFSQVRGNEIQMFRPQVSSDSNIAAPRNVLPRRVTGVTAQQLQQRHVQERRSLTQRFNSQSNEMQRRHQQEIRAAISDAKRRDGQRHPERKCTRSDNLQRSDDEAATGDADAPAVRTPGPARAAGARDPGAPEPAEERIGSTSIREPQSGLTGSEAAEEESLRKAAYEGSGQGVNIEALFRER